MALLTPEQLREIRQIIADHHTAFVANVVSPEALSEEDLRRLRDLGLVDVKVSSIEEAYLYGQVLAAADDPRVARMSLAEFREYLRKNPVPLSPIEQHAVAMAQQEAAQWVVGLGNRVDRATGAVAIEADAEQRRMLRDVIRTATAKNVARRESVKKLKSDLGWASRDWTRDWDRIAITEKHRAMQRGVADYYGKRHGGEARVALRSMPDCCEHCRKLTVGADGQPLIFKLSDLEANGTNVGRKAREWLAVVPPIHPHCVCQMIRVPDGWGFNEEGQLVPGGELGEAAGAEKSFGRVELEDELRKAYETRGTVDFQGLTVVVENPPGSVRKWPTPDGGTGQTRMKYAYGYFKGTEGADLDGVDCFVGPDRRAETAYVIHQQDPQTGVYDEDKVMIGWPDERTARQVYLDHYNRSDFLVAVSKVKIDQLRRLLRTPKKAAQAPVKTPEPVLVVPLSEDEVQKARIPKEYAGGMEGARAPGPGTMVNYVLKMPPPLPKHPTPKELRGELDEVALDVDRHVISRDKSVYDVTVPVPVYARPIDTPEGRRGEELGVGLAELRRDHVEEVVTHNRGATKNAVEPEESDQDDLPKRRARRRRKRAVAAS